MEKKIRRGLFVGLLIFSGFLGCCIGANAASQESELIKLGVTNPLTGPAGPWGLMIQCANETFKKFINDRGGITVKGKKYKIDIVYADDKYTATGGRIAAEKLLYVDNVSFLVGSFGAAPISGWAPLAIKEKKLAVIGGPTWSPKPEWPYLFRVVASDNERSEVLCSLMKDKLACKSILYLFSDDLTGKNAKENAIENEKERGLQVKGYIMVPTSTTDFYPFLTNALRSNPDYIHCKTPVGSIALVVKQARELGYKGYITSPTSMPGDLEKWQGIAGVEASKGFIGIMASPEEYSSLGLEYNALWEQICPKIKSTDLAYSVHAHILMMAIEKAQSFDPDDILKVLRTAEFHSFHKLPLKASGEKTFGIKNHMTVPVPYSTVVGKGQIKYLGSAQMFTP